MINVALATITIEASGLAIYVFKEINLISIAPIHWCEKYKIRLSMITYFLHI